MSLTESDIQATKSKNKILIPIIIAAVSVLLIGGLVYLRRQPPKESAPANLMQARLENAIRPGNPEWDKYVNSIKLDPPEAFESPRGLGDTFVSIQTVVRNFTGRTLSGLELRGTLLDSNNQLIKETTESGNVKNAERFKIVVPSMQPELENNKTIKVSVPIEGLKESYSGRAQLKLEISGFRFKE